MTAFSFGGVFFSSVFRLTTLHSRRRIVAFNRKPYLLIFFSHVFNTRL